jgi:hypothetical protein
MKTKILYRVATLAAFSGILFMACNKSNSSASTDTPADMQVQSDDESRFSNESDAVSNDVNTAMSFNSTVSGAGAAAHVGYGQGVAFEGIPHTDSPNPICDATITVDTANNPRTITITYNGNNCNVTRTRTGVVVISIPQGVHWADKGAQVTVTITNLKIVRLLDQKSITLNGTHVYTNVSGGSLTNIVQLGSITHTVTSSNMSVTFDNGTQRSWQLARQRVYAYANSTLTATETGMHTDGTTSGISEWGTNRFGNSFETVITTPLVISSGCGFQLVSGAAELIRPNVTINVTFGLDSQGNSTSCPVSGSYYFKLVWEGAGGKTYTFILPY